MTTPTYAHKMAFDVTTLGPKEFVLGKWPALQNIPALIEHGSGANDKWLRYAILLTDRGSGLIKLPDLKKRKQEALRLAGIEPGPTRVADVLAFKDVGVRALVMAWLRMQDDLLLSFVITGREMIYQHLGKMATPIEEQDGGEMMDGPKPRGEEKEADVYRAYKLQGELFDNMQARIKEIRAAEKELFADDEDVREMVLKEAQAGTQATGWERRVLERQKQ
jgi:hypothetical protein